MRPCILLLLPVALTIPATAAPRNPQVDYGGFVRLTDEVAPKRRARLLGFDAFKKKAAKGNALILDARSKDAFAEGHIAGAVNLPLTDFTAESLAEVIGKDNKRPILIYCNNNFRNHTRPVPLKLATLALNIQTFINLTGYGYPNVWELSDVVNFNDPKIGWVGTGMKSASR